MQGDIFSAYDDLLNAFEHLEPTADRSALDAALEKAQTVADEIQEGKYLPDGQKDFRMHGERHWTSAEMQVRKKSIQQPKLW